MSSCHPSASSLLHWLRARLLVSDGSGAAAPAPPSDTFPQRAEAEGALRPATSDLALIADIHTIAGAFVLYLLTGNY